MADADLLIRNCGELVTPMGQQALRGPALGAVRRIPAAAVWAHDGTIRAVGPESEILRVAPTRRRELDAGGGAVLPGFVDPHTHAVFGAARAAEYAARCEGQTYVEIAAAGGGIQSSVRDVRHRELDDLVRMAIPRLRRMLAHGTTTLEIKSGYGLSLADEQKLLVAIAALRAHAPQQIVATFMGAHEIPPEYRHDRAAYVRLIIEEMIPAVAPLAEFNDVFCEPTVFTLEESERILRAGLRHGLRPKLHADELAPYGATELACRLGCVSADHLMHVSAAGMRALADSETIAVLLPATSFGLGLRDYAPARDLVNAGAAIALATDFNPGSSYCDSMQAVWSLACSMLRLTPAEGLVAATLNAAAALGRAGQIGSLEAGKRCDLMVTSGADYREVPYHFGANDIRCVIIGGRVVWMDPDGASPAESGES